MMSPEQKRAKFEERFDSLKEVAEELKEELHQRHTKVGGDIREIAINHEKLTAIALTYVDALDDYKLKQGYYRVNKLVGPDKICGIMSFLIGMVAPFESMTGVVNTPYSASMNETFAYRFACYALKIRPELVPKGVGSDMIRHFAKPKDFLSCMLSWTITAMRLFGLKYGRLDRMYD